MKKVLVIVGPTASGKSDLAVKLAQKLNGEVISADSRQVYKGLNVGTGKITKKEMRGIPHHMLDVADPKKPFAVSEYKILALKKIEEILGRNKLPIIVGGTGFYIDALRMSLPEVPPNPKLRKKLALKSVEELSLILGEHKVADRNNKVRLIRAIEIVEALGHIPKIKAENKYDFVFVGLNPKDLYKRILERLAKRLTPMVKEARKLHKQGLTYERMEELGLEYRYLARLLQKKITQKQFVDELYAETKKYSKRQMTWFKKNKNITWFGSSKSALATTPKLLARVRR
ncbi:tRNA (adenosine(37)-N6)-dimethylallyltransferase MiaA [Candidatus Parcubacteria bacterium]|nr:tRNA (adenosine(37)-N6)-dimethylallyltransferase MiaA [Candidatus Parcubacteria bacterium]